MGQISKGRRVWLPAALIGLCFGCTNQDADRLARVGRTVAAKAEELTGGANGKLAAGWQAVRADLDEMALDSRISARLRWDKSLANAQIRIHTQGGEVELLGTVNDPAQRQRAVELAESTIGTEKVVDKLEVASQAEGSKPSAESSKPSAESSGQ
jgi:osmotically-inducible protein OsmY